MNRLFDAFSQEGHQLYLVGGAVRDLLRGIPLSRLADLDFATDALPERTTEILRKHRFSVYEIGKRFGTVGTVLNGPSAQGFPKDCQITTFRARETYSAGSRHPSVAYGSCIQDDLWRRDFSVNSIAMLADGTLVDPYGGKEDIERGVLRSIGDPLVTLQDDPLRILRIGRFLSTLGYRPDEPLVAAAELCAPWILAISRERWAQEMTKLLVGEYPERALEFLRDCRVLGMILPEVAILAGFQATEGSRHKDIWLHTLAVVKSVKPDPTLRWAALLHDTGKVWTRRIAGDGSVTFHRHEEHSALLAEGIATRFRLGRQLAESIDLIIRLHGRVAAYNPDWGDGAVRKLAGQAGPHIGSLLEFARADLTTAMARRRSLALEQVAHLEDRITRMQEANSLQPRLPHRLGTTLADQFGLKPGPRIGGLIDRIKEAILASELPAAPTSQQCIDWLRALPEPELERALNRKLDRPMAADPDDARLGSANGKDRSDSQEAN
ncbi:MAG: HD domain-containing protein [Bradymonadales bacterium]|nr:HD domain-containing protein [Bradymonadales bacterium]